MMRYTCSFGNRDINIMQEVMEGSLPVGVAEKYLNIYVGLSDWPKHIGTVWERLSKTNGAPEELKDQMKQILACAILLPAVERNTYIDKDNPHIFLLKIPSFTQLHDRNWFELLQKVVEKDVNIERWRKEVMALGIVHPIEYAPYTRQAYNWLYQSAEQSGAINPDNQEDIVNRYKSLVWAYGGAVICNIFSRHEEVIKRIVNWRTGYFFERQIYEVYTLEQILKIKTAELEKTNSRLVQKL